MPLSSGLARRLTQKIALISLFAAASCLAQSAKPLITKIDPPNWFAGLPASLLLVHGEHLENTTFAVRHSAARITETTISPDGHWAFIGFDPGTHPGTIELVAKNPRGTTTVSYALISLRPQSDQPRGFNSRDVMYLIMPDRFADGDEHNDALLNFPDPDDRSRPRAYHGGDLRGIEQHLDYLKQLGVTTIWTTPLYDNSREQSGQSYHGYSATDMYAVDPHLGTMADLQSLVRAAHARGMKVVLDTVPNHVGAKHPWAADPPMPGWLHGSVASHIEAFEDFSSIVDPKGDPALRNRVLNGWFVNVLPDLNQDNPLVATYLTQNAIWWIETAGLDGLRIDTFPYVPRSFWHNYFATLHRLYPTLSEVGEVFTTDTKTTSFFAGGRANLGSDGAVDTNLNTPFDYPMFFALRAALTRHKPMTAIADVLADDHLYPHPERLVTFIGNHDTKRFLSEPGADEGALHLAFGLLATLRGMPQLYYGDEIEMKGSDDPENRHDFPGGFPHDKADAFTREGRTANQESMEEWVSKLLQLRAATAALSTGQLQVVESSERTLAFVRGAELTSGCTSKPGSERYLIVANADTTPQDVTISPTPSALSGCTRFTPVLSPGSSLQLKSDGLHIHLSSQELTILRAEP